MGVLDSAIGAPLVCAWINAMLYTLELVQASSVLQNAPSDRWDIKAIVFAVLIIDTVGTMMACAQVYLSCVTNWGNFMAAGGPTAVSPWTYTVSIAMTAAGAFVVHAFLLHRLWSLSHNPALIIGMASIAMLALAGAVWTVYTFATYPLLIDANKWFTPSGVWIASSAVADVGLALALVWWLRGVKSSFKSTNSVLRRLTIMAIETGATTSAIFMLDMALFLSRSPTASTVAVGIELVIGRTYGNTIMYNLGMRRRIAGSSGARTTGFEEPNPISLNGIQVTRDVRTHVDHPIENDVKSGVRSLSDPETPSAYFPS